MELKGSAIATVTTSVAAHQRPCVLPQMSNAKIPTAKIGRQLLVDVICIMNQSNHSVFHPEFIRWKICVSMFWSSSITLQK
jgi:hypothetical protein